MFPIRDSQPSHRFPAVNILLVLLNAAVFLHQISLSDFELTEFILRHGVVPANFESIDLLTSMFMHGGWMHLIGNMWFLWIFGDNIEDILGHGKYLAFYLLCGIAGSVMHVAFNPASTVPAVGASGAIAGVMGAYLVKFPASRITTLVFFIITVEVPALFMIGYWFITQVFSGVGSLAATTPQQGGTAWWGHIGGFVCGFVLIKLLPTRSRWTVRSEYGW
jgi:membrane associated rhomboid family serine protease